VNGIPDVSEVDYEEEPKPTQRSRWAYASLIMGVLGLTVLPVVGGILAIVFYFKAKKEILTTDLEGMAIAKVGWSLGVLSLVLFGIALFVVLDRSGIKKFADDFLNKDTLRKSIPLVGRAFIVNIELALVSEVFILIFGLIIALLRISKFRTIRILAAVYIDVIRGLPLILQIVIIYFGLSYLGLNLSRFTAGVVAVTVCYAAYEAEIFRAGIESIHKGQMEASRSLGMTYLQSMRYVVLPQAVRRVIPPLSNEFVMLTKDTALVSTIGLLEAFLQGRDLMGRYANVTPLVVVAMYFLLVTLPLMRLVQYLETRLARGD
jgi:polar amino acid transport system permease protein